MPAVAGQFYPKENKRLRAEIASLVDENLVAKEIIGAMLPHAGYAYSGRVASATLASCIVKDKVIILGPNHTGYGKPFGIMTGGRWQMPFGPVEIDAELAGNLLKDSDYLEDDALSHLYEHSIEVELPFLQYFKENFQFVPISVSTDEPCVYRNIGSQIAGTIKKLKLENLVTIIASSDMTHYEPQSIAEKKDRQALEAVLELDEIRLIEVIEKMNISMCGYAPVTIMLVAAKSLGAKRGELISYQTSGDITGDYHSVVGYAGVIVY
jgi:hypothetical protein